MFQVSKKTQEKSDADERIQALEDLLTSELKKRNAQKQLAMPPMPEKSKEQLQKEAEDKARKVGEEEALAKELYAKCSTQALDNLKLAEDLRPLICNDKIGTDKTFCIVGYIDYQDKDHPEKVPEKFTVVFFGTNLDYMTSKNEPFNQRDPLELKNKTYQFDFSDFNVKNYIDSSEKADPPIKTLDTVDYIFQVKESFSDRMRGYKFPTEEEIRDKFSLDEDAILIQASETYPRFSITGPTKKYGGKEGSSLEDGGHVEYFWGTIKTKDGTEIKMGEEKIYGARLLEAKSEETEAEPKE